MEVADRLICYFFGFPQDGIGFFVCLPDNPVPLFFQLFLPLLCLGFQRFCFFPVCLDFRTFLFDCAAAGFQISKQVFKGNILLTQPLPGVFDNKLRKPQLSGNGKCITLSGNADEQTVSRTQTFYVKFSL